MKHKDDDKSIWQLITEAHASHKQSASEDLADSIALMIICGLVLFMVFG